MRMRRSVTNSNLCSAYNISEENGMHVFRDCQIVRETWAILFDGRPWPDFYAFNGKSELLRICLVLKFGMIINGMFSLVS